MLPLHCYNIATKLFKTQKMNSNDVRRLLKQDGWLVKNQNGSHVQLVHPVKKGKVTVPAHGKKEIPPKTLKSILKQAGL